MTTESRNPWVWRLLVLGCLGIDAAVGLIVWAVTR